MVPMFVREIEKGWHDFQLDKIILDAADPRLIAACTKRALVLSALTQSATLRSEN